MNSKGNFTCELLPEVVIVFNDVVPTKLPVVIGDPVEEVEEAEEPEDPPLVEVRPVELPVDTVTVPMVAVNVFDVDDARTLSDEEN